MPDCNKIAIPIHLEKKDHWTLIIINTKEKIYRYYDSLQNEGNVTIERKSHVDKVQYVLTFQNM